MRALNAYCRDMRRSKLLQHMNTFSKLNFVTALHTINKRETFNATAEPSYEIVSHKTV